MSSKSNKNRKTNNNKGNNKVPVGTKLKEIIRDKNFKWAVIFAVIIVAIVLTAEIYPYIAPFNAPSSIKPNTYYQISNKDILSNGSSAVFFISWYGCPIGATDSWPLYYAMNSTENIRSDVSLHTSSPTDVYANQPGLLFDKNITFKESGNKFTFYPLYVYNESMTGTIHNKSISNKNLVSAALSEIKASMPSGVYNLFVKYKSTIASGSPSHISTTTIITGPKGTYILNAFMYAVPSSGILGSGLPTSSWNANPPQHVMAGMSGSATITNPASTFSGYLNKVG